MSGPLIGTHSGHFHADEALAVYLLRLLPEYSNSTLVRTRDADKLAPCHTVVDVGGVYDHAAKRYDHHQREFTTTFPNHTTKLSSAGLVYMHYAKDIICACTGLQQDSSDVELLYQKLYDDFIEAFDANDNGVSAYDPNALRKAGIEKSFSDRGFSIASVVNRLNYSHPSPLALAKHSLSTEAVTLQGGISVPLTADAESKSPEAAQSEEDERFLKASQFCGDQFVSEWIKCTRGCPPVLLSSKLLATASSMMPRVALWLFLTVPKAVLGPITSTLWKRKRPLKATSCMSCLPRMATQTPNGVFVPSAASLARLRIARICLMPGKVCVMTS
jgi:hypothetical protein